MNVRELRDRRATILGEARAVVETAEKEDRNLKQEEQDVYDSKMSDAKELETRIARLEAMPEMQPVSRKAPAVINHRGVDEVRAIAAFVKRGDMGAVREFITHDERGNAEVEIRIPSIDEIRAVTDSTMNITTNADGKYIDPTGWTGRVALRRAEIRLAERLGVQKIPGKGTTVPFPYENADAQEMASTSEQSDAHGNDYERDAMQFGSKNFTLVKYTKKYELTEELLEDEDVNVMNAVGDNIGRAQGITHNKLLLTEVASSGTLLKTFAGAAAIAAGEVESMVYHDTLDYYMDDGGSLHWVMRPSTFGKIKSITANPRMYAQQNNDGKRQLEEYPVHYSNQAAAIAAEAKTVFFGNWWYVGMREAPTLKLIRDIYSVDGAVVLKYSFRAVYGVLIAGAIGYGAQAAAST